MDSINHNPIARTGLPDESQDETSACVLSIEQLQHLVRLLDNSDVSELELNRPAEGTHLVLRKARTSGSKDSPVKQQYVPAPVTTPGKVDSVKNEHKVLSPLVGTFHTWAKPKGGALVAVGDSVKAGQLVGTIESLNVLNEVETTVAGYVAEIYVQEGQPVEYGQELMTINKLDGA